jgi:hypothetical protein
MEILHEKGRASFYFSVCRKDWPILAGPILDLRARVDFRKDFLLKTTIILLYIYANMAI